MQPFAALRADLIRQLHEAGQKPREGLAGACGRDQQDGTSRARLFEQFELMRPRLPATGREPSRNAREKQGCFQANDISHQHRRKSRLRHAGFNLVCGCAKPPLALARELGSGSLNANMRPQNHDLAPLVAQKRRRHRHRRHTGPGRNHRPNPRRAGRRRPRDLRPQRDAGKAVAARHHGSGLPRRSS